MVKERFEALQAKSLGHLKDLVIKDVTEAEFNEGYHYCQDWDGLFIGPESEEFKCCVCLGPWRRK